MAYVSIKMRETTHYLGGCPRLPQSQWLHWGQRWVFSCTYGTAFTLELSDNTTDLWLTDPGPRDFSQRRNLGKLT